MPYSLKQAADATGKSKQTILRAIQAHKISAEKDVHGEWQIDPAELHRVYDPIAVSGASDVPQVYHTPLNENIGLVQELNHLREMIVERDKMLMEREKRLADKDAVISDKDTDIRDLRDRLDRESEERRRVHAQLAGLLTDQRTQAEKEKAVRRRWFKWW
ncbi:conserved hypothetical protein [Gammaproteobacteria bacterium]